MIERKPTDKQIWYAKHIAEVLSIDEPDFNFYEGVCEFITKYKSSAMIQENIEKYKLTSIDFDEIFSDDFANLTSDRATTNIVYFLYNEDEIVYIGKSIRAHRVLDSLRERISQSPITHAGIHICETESDMHILEMVCITILKPKLNRDGQTKDIPKLFTLPDFIKDIKKVEVFGKSDRYYEYKERELNKLNIDLLFFDKIVQVSKCPEQAVLRVLIDKHYMTKGLINEALKQVEKEELLSDIKNIAKNNELNLEGLKRIDDILYLIQEDTVFSEQQINDIKEFKTKFALQSNQQNEEFVKYKEHFHNKHNL